MAGKEKRTFSGIFSQSVVVCLLVFFTLIVVVAMFFTVEVSDETVWIGMAARPLDAEAAAALGIPSGRGGVMVGEVDGIAQRAGIRHGDVLLGINGEPVRGMADFSKLVRRTDVARRGAQLDIIRQGVRVPVFVLPHGGPAGPPDQATPRGIVRAPAVVDQRWLGVEAETFTAGEGRALGIPAGVGGVVIDGVGRGSQAEWAGLMTNDVIVSVNGLKTDTATDLWNTLAGLDGAGRVEFGLYRRGQLMSVALPTALGTLAGGLLPRTGGWGPGRFQFCPNASGTFAGGFPGRMGGRGLGPGGFLVCPGCGSRVAHQRGVPSFTVPCPSCGTTMIREELLAGPPAASGAPAGGFPGRMGGGGLGPGGFLVCPGCGTRVAHQRGVPCFTVPCPSCGTMMVRGQ